MVDLSKVKDVYLYGAEIDFRNGIEGLSNLIFTEFNKNEINNKLFIFFNKTKKQVKIIEIEADGIWLYQKRLSTARFIFPNVDEKIRIDRRQLKIILENIKIIEKRARERLTTF